MCLTLGAVCCSADVERRTPVAAGAGILCG